MGIGDNIRRYRHAAGLSQAELAEIIGKTRSAVSQYESNKTTPYMYVIEKIADALHVSTADIITESGKLTAYEKELLDVARMISTDGQRQLLIYARGLAATYPLDNSEIQTA